MDFYDIKTPATDKIKIGTTAMHTHQFFARWGLPVSVLALSGCYAPPPSLPKPENMNIASVMAADCGGGALLYKAHPAECTRPIQPYAWTSKSSVLNGSAVLFTNSSTAFTTTTYKGLSIDLAAALLASAGKDASGGEGAATVAGDDTQSLPLSNMVANAGVLTAGAGAVGAGGSLGLAGIALGLLSGGGGNQQPTYHYTIAANLPFLSYYRFFPKSVLAKNDVFHFAPYMQQGYELILSARGGTPIKPGSLIFNGQLYWCAESLCNNTTTFTPSSASGNNHRFNITWSTSVRKNTGSHLVLMEVVTPAKPIINPKVGFMIAVRTGQPNNFYNPKQVLSLQRHLPFANKWYAVFNTETPQGLMIDVLHNGKVFSAFHQSKIVAAK
jgi:hypothetical protein